jgi:predicted O-methyltransferase YrrM
MEVFAQIANMAKVIEVKHLLKAIADPSHALAAAKYQYRRVSQRRFIEFLATQWECRREAIDAAYDDLDRNSPLWEAVEKHLSIYPNGYGLQMTRELSVLYLIVRLIQPQCIVETGVSAGASSAYILRALEDNNKGRLYSIDVPPDNLPEGKTSGWIVPEALRHRWRLLIGDSKALLEPLLSGIGEIDCFLHDSLHTYEHMAWEFRTAWKHLRPGGLFLSHDVGANEAFFDFMKEKGIAWTSYRVFHVLGGFRKPRASRPINLLEPPSWDSPEAVHPIRN